MTTQIESRLPVSKLTKTQQKFFVKEFKNGKTKNKIKVRLRYDDDCGNGHNTFSITGEIYEGRKSEPEVCGCIHEEIEKHFPEFKKFIKWHLCSSDGPMHYVANTTYHASQYAPKNFWVYLEGVCMKYGTQEELQYFRGKYGDNVKFEVDPKSGKVADFEAARHSAIWPEATDSELISEIALLSRLPKLMEEFKKDMEELGFTY